MKRTFMSVVLLVPAVSAVCIADGNTASPGEIRAVPTLTCLGIEWSIEGDANSNAHVSVAYRQEGQETWLQAMDLMRVENIAHTGHIMDEPVIAESERGRRFWNFDPPVEYGNLLAGSIFHLDPDTSYEVRLELQDPDGGAASRTVTARTRAVPQTPATGRTLHVAPGATDGDGSEAKPFGDPGQAQREVRPGDTVLLHEGTYEPISIGADGRPGLPITWRGRDRAKVIITGDRAVNCVGRRHLIIENLTIEATHMGVNASQGSDVAIRGCRIRTANSGIYADLASELLIADNVVTGPVNWTDPKGPQMRAEGISVSGAGHVICRNLIANVCDGINATGGQLATNNVDIYRNDIWICTDDAIEADHVGRNIRVFENRMTNCSSSMSNQPLFGGPCYWIRNVSYACGGGFKFNCNPSGIVALHNTIVAYGIAWSGMDARNLFLRGNIFAGGRLDKGKGPEWNSLHGLRGVKLDWDRDAVLRTSHARLIEIYAPGRAAPVGKVNYASMKELFEDTGLEEHGIEITWEDFERIEAQPDAETVIRPDSWSVMLRSASAAVDAGEVVPNISDRYEGARPDIGAWETGQPVPHYGPDPRVQPVDFDQIPTASDIQVSSDDT